MGKRLTEDTIRKLPPAPKGRREEHSDREPGLALRVTNTGAMSFVVRARIEGERHPIRLKVADVLTGGEKDALIFRLTFGKRAGEEVSLPDVRDVARGVLQMCEAGQDPRQVQTADATKADERLWENVVAAFIAEYCVGDDPEKPRRKSWWMSKLLLEKHTKPWNGRVIGDITRGDVKEVLDAAEEGSVYVANRTLAAIRKLFNWAVLQELVNSSPIVRGMAREGEQERTRFLTFDEVRLVWRGCARIGQPFGPLFKLLLATGQRRSEVGSLEWLALDLDEQRLWTMKDNKAGRPHLVPLTDLALSILRAQPLIDDPDLAEEIPEGSNRSAAVYVFTTTGRTPVSGFSDAKEDLDTAILEIQCEDAEAAGLRPEDVEPMADWRLHDLRRTVATHMEDALDVPPHIVGSVLNHAPRGYKGVTAVYTRGSLIYQRRRALAAWARLLALAVEGGETWGEVARILRPETEAEHARTDEFRRMIQADEQSWAAFLAQLRPVPAAVAA
jgi:integrase